jgi:hypothetical protein
VGEGEGEGEGRRIRKGKLQTADGRRFKVQGSRGK